MFSPFERGNATVAGQSKTHKDYGKFIAIRATNGKYMSLSARAGQGQARDQEDRNGLRRRHGRPHFSVGPVYVDQVFYHCPNRNPHGSPYGG